jgi:hypothetical protein
MIGREMMYLKSWERGQTDPTGELNACTPGGHACDMARHGQMGTLKVKTGSDPQFLRTLMVMV